MRLLLLIVWVLCFGCDTNRAWHTEDKMRTSWMLTQIVRGDITLDELGETVRYKESPALFAGEYDLDCELTWAGRDGAFGSPDDVTFSTIRTDRKRVVAEYERLRAELIERNALALADAYAELKRLENSSRPVLEPDD